MGKVHIDSGGSTGSTCSNNVVCERIVRPFPHKRSTNSNSSGAATRKKEAELVETVTHTDVHSGKYACYTCIC